MKTRSQAAAIVATALVLAGCCDDKDAACLQSEAQRKAQQQAAQFVDVPSTAATLRPLVAPPPQPQIAAPQPVAQRFTLSRVQIARDGLAYGGERGIYVLKDAETGREYIGVSGVGITEIGRHNCGKACTKEDER